MNYVLTVVISIFIAACASAPVSDSSANGVYMLPPPEKISSGAFSFLDHIVGSKKIVQLGESIHMTREFPLVRTALARHLAAQQNFDIILFEGSVVDSWLASDLILNTPNPGDSALVKARNMAFPSIWHSPEYSEIFKGPFYVASYDLQPGMGGLKEKSLPQFFAALARYAKPAGGVKRFRILENLSNRKTGFPNFPIANEEEYYQALSELRPWLVKVAAVIEKKFPGTPHGRILKIVPTAFEYQIELWKAHFADPEIRKWKAFQETRDRLGAKMIQAIRNDVSKAGKVMVWAHHVHVFHNQQKLSRHSLGADLKASLGDEVYTIGLFAGEGDVYALADMEEIVEGAILPAKDFEFESKLQKYSNGSDVFVDFKEIEKYEGNSWLESSQTSRLENVGKIKIVPGRDFDAAIFVQKVSKPKLPWSK